MTIFRQMLKAKIQGACITKRILDYNGSIGIDRALLLASGILHGEKVQVLNFNNGKRLETYVIEEQTNSGIVALYGPAARCGETGDKLCIISYVLVSDDEVRQVEVKTIFVDENNKVIR
jgi:aspartate 1-decarboxylase